MLNKTIYSTIFPYLQDLPVAPQTDDRRGPNPPPDAAAANAAGTNAAAANAPSPAQPTAPPAGRPIELATQGVMNFLANGPSSPAPAAPAAAAAPPYAPGVVDNGYSDPSRQDYVSSLATTPTVPSAMPNETATPSAGKKKRHFGPDIDPNASPEDQARAAVKFWEDQRQNPTNQNKGWQGLIHELVENFLYGMSKTQPGMGWKEGLTLGAAGAGAGFINKGMNEERKAEMELPGARDRLQFETNNALRQGQIANQQNEILNRNARTRIDMDDSVRKQLTAEQDNLLKVWAGKSVVDSKNNPDDKRLINAAAKAGLILTDKQPSDRFTTTVAPNGSVVVTNTVTGDYTVGNENLSKPGKIDDKMVDELLGLEDDKVLENKATAAVAQGLTGTTFRPEVVNALPPEARNPDGSFNMEAFSRMKEADDPRVASVTLDKIIANAPDDYKQRHAAEVEKLRGSQKDLRTQAVRLRAALSSHHPGPNAKPKPLTTVVDTFKAIISKPPSKERDQALEDFYNKYLPNVSIGS